VLCMIYIYLAVNKHVGAHVSSVANQIGSKLQ
jgi:hypothetical protein